MGRFAPIELAEDWDNVGLLVGDWQAPIERIMTCLTITPSSAAEAIRGKADLIITHHPLPFRALKRVTTDTTAGRLLWDLVGHRVAIYSPHTAFDSATAGINQRLAEGLDLGNVMPLVTVEGAPDGTGSGRQGNLKQPCSLQELASRLKQFLRIQQLQAVGNPAAPIQQVAVACGAAGEMLPAASVAGCELLIVGETNLHTCLEAEARGMSLLLPGHYASERFAVEILADDLSRHFGQIHTWVSQQEQDPLKWM
jgi:dinuclear metal center YbgI/SA1388 family protein